MKITAIETVRIAAVPNILWARVHTQSGLIGLGESYFDPAACETHIHERIAPYLLGRDARDVNRHYANLVGYVGRIGSGAEQRGRAMVDMAMWDLLGQGAGLSLCRLLGGAVRDSIPVYNTCAGATYNVRPNVRESSFDHGVGDAVGEMEDTTAFLETPVELAESLLAMGISGMKIWPFDFVAEATHGVVLSIDSLKAGLAPFEAVRAALGDRIELMCELHGLWSVPAARQIGEALAPLGLRWIEDPVPMAQADALGILRQAGVPPIAMGETMGGIGQYRSMVASRDVDYVVADLSWGGGITHARKVADYADAHGLAVLFHDSTGPVALAASTHLALATPACPMQEIARAYYLGWYRDMVDGLPELHEGRLRLADRPGLGVALRPECLRAEGTSVRRSAL